MHTRKKGRKAWLLIVVDCFLLIMMVQFASAAPKVPKANEKGETALARKMPLRSAHQLAGVTCVNCHGKTKKPELPAMDKCVACHGSTAELAEKTANVKPENPHNSPHWGPDMDCNVCHHEHAKSENYCFYCHNFNFKVP